MCKPSYRPEHKGVTINTETHFNTLYFICLPQKKENHTGLEPHEGEKTKTEFSSR